MVVTISAPVLSAIGWVVIIVCAPLLILVLDGLYEMLKRIARSLEGR